MQEKLDEFPEPTLLFDALGLVTASRGDAAVV